MSVMLEDYQIIVLDVGSIVYPENGRFELLPSVREWLAQQPLRAPDQPPFIVMVEYMPIAVGSKYVPMAARLARRLPVDGAKALFGQWPDSCVLNLCRRLYGGLGRGVLLGNSRLHLAAAHAADYDFFYVQALFATVAQVGKGDETAVSCPRCGPGQRLIIGRRNSDKLVCDQCGYRAKVGASVQMLNDGAVRLL